MEPCQIEFLAENEVISIVPKFTLDKVELIQGDIGPFTAGLQVAVPLWAAIHLKQSQNCRILPPDWLEPEQLKAKKAEEKDEPFFTEMPSEHYAEVTQLLLQHAIEDIPKADEIRTLVKDIWDTRLGKLRSSIDMFVKSDSTHANVNNLTALELSTVRDLLTNSLDHMHKLRRGIDATKRDQP